MTIDIIHLFLTSGKTFTFKDVELAADNESMLVFNYKAASDSKMKQAIFSKSHIAGWSRTL